MNDQTETQRIRQMNAEQIEKIKGQLTHIQRSFLAIKKSGINEDILIAFLKEKTGMGKGDLWSVLRAQEDFYKKLAKLGE